MDVIRLDVTEQIVPQRFVVIATIVIVIGVEVMAVIILKRSPDFDRGVVRGRGQQRTALVPIEPIDAAVVALELHHGRHTTDIVHGIMVVAAVMGITMRCHVFSGFEIVQKVGVSGAIMREIRVHAEDVLLKTTSKNDFGARWTR